MDGKSIRQRSSLFGLPLFFAGCSLILNDLPPRIEEDPSAGSGGQSGNQGGKSTAGGSVGSGNAGQNSTGAEPAGGVGAGGTVSQGGQNATGGQLGTSGSTSDAGSDGSGGSGCPCDCDKDGSLNDDPGCHMGGGLADCDDEDNKAKPGQTAWITMASLVVDFDYDCDNATEQEVTTTLMCPALLSECDPNEGYIGMLPACGDPGDWGRCEPNGLGGCHAVVKSNTRKMGCH